ncbi:hypothetical protein [Arenibacter palladensis]|uniref:hypothetical protein n=1 Tax=Arenibacter palladensis TaxID=237373 RepID=UPI0026E26F26|nr:hypothetical protein [Arenibacter palladensis]MDO6605684.1 hypothetical protein [Arenibacter palladensis]
MMKKNGLFIAIFLSLLALSCSEDAIKYNKLGDLKIKTTKEISSSPISIGGETLDRDYANYHSYKNDLDFLGAKKVKLQADWAKTEKTKGVYGWGWLDSIITDLGQCNIETWLQTSYGNPIYEGGGVANLAGGIPSSKKALLAWDVWVRQMALRYKGKVKVWEIWNEPDWGKEVGVKEYAELYIRTAEIIREIIPNATLYALALSNPYNTEYTKLFLDELVSRDKVHLLDEITFHGYILNPSTAYERLKPLKQLISLFDARIKMHQGEQGCPPTFLKTGALNSFPWTKVSQSKWTLRRLLGDLGNGYQTQYFQIADMNYGKNTATHITGINTKCLLKTDKNNNVKYTKPWYYAVRNLISFFDEELKNEEKVKFEVNLDSPYSVYAFNKTAGNQFLSLWFDSEVPSNTTNFTLIDFKFENLKFKKTVYVDVYTREVYEIPKASGNYDRNGSTILNVPVTDYPTIIA